MKMITHSSVLIALVLCSAAARAQSPSSLIKVSELKAKTFNIDGLVFTIKKLDDKTFSRGVGYVELLLENVASNPITFQPSRFAVVGKDNMQAFLSYQYFSARRVQPTEIMVVPGAKVEMEYDLSIRFMYPAKLFYGERQLAEVTN
jgi:hypothetical protein